MSGTTQHELFEADAPPEPDAAAAADLYADIVFDRPLDHAYTYAVGPSLQACIAVGKRVAAPFGRGNRPAVGYCIRVAATAPPRPVKELLEVLDDEPLLNDSLLRLTRWMADYYLCGWGQVLNGIIPAGAREQAGTRTLTLIEAVPEADWPVDPPELGRKQRVALEQLQLQSEPIDLRQLMRLARCGSAPIAALVAKGFARRVRRRVESAVPPPEITDPTSADPPIALNADQEVVSATVSEAIRAGGFRTFLLHGVTGSGKTEIYLRAIEEVNRLGKEAVVLVPEISLTPQTIARFQGRCGNVAVLHSHLGAASRGSQWRRVASGHVQVVVGARSAVFAPCRNLGLIVVDEEHESTFKQEQTPRYHGRDVAVMRGRLENIPVLLGSATPSLESWHNAQRGQYTLLNLPQRVLDRPLPPVVLLDRRHEKPKRGRFPALSDPLVFSMRQALLDGGQVILLLNRRGFDTHIHCPACGHVATCRFCDLAMTYHRQRDLLLCHYCGYENPPIRECPVCQQPTMRYLGLGTEKLEIEIAERFPGIALGRMDSDTMRRPGSHERLLTQFRAGQIQILLGTQMIAKGLDFPNVTLVGVVNADVGLHVPDFRAAERTFQLLSQVAGRAGRGPRGGKVLVQTFSPEHPAIALAAGHDFLGFAKGELAHRRTHHYPPYQRLARVIVRAHEAKKAEEHADRLAGAFTTTMQRLSAQEPMTVRLLGPAEAPVFRLKGWHRYHFQLQSPDPGALHRVLREALASVRPVHGIETTVDIDPHDML